MSERRRWWAPGATSTRWPRVTAAVLSLVAVALAGCAASDAPADTEEAPPEEANDPVSDALAGLLDEAGAGSVAENIPVDDGVWAPIEGLVVDGAGSPLSGARVWVRCEDETVVTSDPYLGWSDEVMTDAGVNGSTDLVADGNVGGVLPSHGEDVGGDGFLYTLFGPTAFVLSDGEGRFAVPDAAVLLACERPIYEAELAGYHMVAPLEGPALPSAGSGFQAVVLALVEG